MGGQGVVSPVWMRTPVLVVSGFLGSGKTTLVRSILKQSQRDGIRTAVISNEFGALGIDEALLTAGMPGPDAIVELAGGCVCCQLSDALVDTLVMLHERVNPDRIVIETSGVALPFETQLHLYRPAVRDWIGDEACVVVVDATGSAVASFSDPNGATANETFDQQVQCADLLILSKVDLVDPSPMQARVQALAPETPVMNAVFGDLPVDVLFPRAPGDQPRAPRKRPITPHAHTHEEFVSTEIVVPPGLSPDEVEARLLGLDALRVKGFVLTSAGPRVVQGVGRRIELVEPGDLVIRPGLVGRVVAIRRTGGTHRH